MTKLQQCHVMAMLVSCRLCYIKTLAGHAKATEAEVIEFLLKFKQSKKSELKIEGGNCGETKVSLFLSDTIDFMKDDRATDEGRLFGKKCPVPIQLELALHLSNLYPPLFVDDGGVEYMSIIKSLLFWSEELLPNGGYDWSRERARVLIEILDQANEQRDKALKFASGWNDYGIRVAEFSNQSLSNEALANVIPVLRRLPCSTSPYADFKPKISWP